MAKTSTERGRAFRARKEEQKLTEVRHIFAHPDDHAEVKLSAAKIVRRRVRAEKRAVKA